MLFTANTIICCIYPFLLLFCCGVHIHIMLLCCIMLLCSFAVVYYKYACCSTMCVLFCSNLHYNDKASLIFALSLSDHAVLLQTETSIRTNQDLCETFPQRHKRTLLSKCESQTAFQNIARYTYMEIPSTKVKSKPYLEQIYEYDVPKINFINIYSNTAQKGQYPPGNHMLATTKNDLFPGHNYHANHGTGDLTVWLLSEHQQRW